MSRQISYLWGLRHLYHSTNRLRGKGWFKRPRWGMSRHALSILILFSAFGCAKPDVNNTDEPTVTCTIAEFTYQVKFPDGQWRKSEVLSCTDNCNKANALDGSGQTFRYCF